MWQKEMFILFMSLALGYVLCVIAKKQTSNLKTLGYALGISVIVMTLLSSLAMSYGPHMKMYKGCMCEKMGKMGCPMMKHCGK